MLVTFLGEGVDVARQGTHMGVHAASVASNIGGSGLRAAGRVMASSQRVLVVERCRHRPNAHAGFAGRGTEECLGDYGTSSIMG